MKKAFWLATVAVLSVLLVSCGSKNREAVERVNRLVEQKQFVAALDVLKLAIDRDPKDAALRRLLVTVMIKADNVDLAYAAFRDLEQISPNDQVLIDLLDDKDPQIRKNAARVLGRSGNKSSVRALTKAMKDPENEVRRAAVTALGAIKDPEAVDTLIAALKDPWWFVRSEAAEALGKIRDPRAAAALFELMGDSDSTVTLAAENALLTFARVEKPPREAYLANVNSPNPEASRVALIGLAILKDQSTTPGLLAMLKSAEPRKRAQAARALGLALDSKALPDLRAAVADKEGGVRLQVAEALGNFQDVQSVEPLKKLASSETEDPRIRRAAAIALAKIVQANPGLLDSSKK
jgi:HEAT repeat protein